MPTRGGKLTLLLVSAIAFLGLLPGAAFAAFEISSFEASGLREDLTPSLDAGERPHDMVNNFTVSLTPGIPPNTPFPAGNIKDVISELPPGVVGNAAAFPKCSQEAMDGVLVSCPTNAQVGFAEVKLRWGLPSGYQVWTVPIFNMDPPPGVAAQFAFRTTASITHVDFHVRTGDDYGVTAVVRNVNETAPVMSSRLTIWGVPGDPSNDDRRVPSAGGVPGETVTPYPEPAPYKVLLSNPTSCGGPLVYGMSASTWQNPDTFVPATPTVAPGMVGCRQLAFDPSVSAKPTTAQGDSPSGLDFHLHLPQNQDANGKAGAQLRDSTVALPASLVVNPSSANGLGACSIQQIGYLGAGGEKQIIRYDRQETATFTVSYGGGSTAPIAATAPAAEVEQALETLPGLAGNLAVSGAPGGWIVKFGGDLAGKDVATLTGTTTAAPVQTVAVTGAGGGFNLGFGGQSTGATFKASFGAGEAFFLYNSASREPKPGEPFEGPGIAPGTKFEFVGGFPEGVGLLSQPTTEAETDALLRIGLPFDVSAAALQEALWEIPALRGNAFVRTVGTSGETRTFEVIFGGELSTAKPALLTATSSLIGPGAGVVVSAVPASPPSPLEVDTVEGAGMPQFTPDAADCPPASEIGTVKIDSPAVIDHTLEGAVYLAKPHENPFGSLLAMYITVDDPASGVVVKLPGRIDADPQSGALTATVADAPQLPFEDLELSFFKGDAAPLKTTVVCGTYETRTDMVPWSAPEGQTRHPASSFSIDQGCAADEGKAPKTTSFDAGTVDPAAGKSSPFVLSLSRPDRSQQLTGIDATLPKGLLAKLAGVPYCSDQALAAAASRPGKAEQANPSCPDASQVGTVTVGAGAGGHPFYAPGKAYLAGPYKGAPLSLAVITPAVAGPFDLGTVVVRNALYVDPTTTQVRAVSDPFPHILQGIPLDIRSIALTLDRSEFTRNPTDCDPFAITGAAAMLTGQSTGLDRPFQATGCERLRFSPKLKLALKGQTKRTGNPAVRAVLTAPPGQANIAKTTVILPDSEFIDQAHVNNPCTRVQFNEGACPAKSILGHAVAYTPLLDKPLEGPVYFRSNGGERKLPDIVADLNGQIHVVLVGYIDSVKTKGSERSRVRTRFLSVPDAPVSRFELSLKGGKRGLIENAENLCRRRPSATVQMTGQNGRPHDFRQKLAVDCGTKNRDSSRGRARGRGEQG